MNVQNVFGTLGAGAALGLGAVVASYVAMPQKQSQIEFPQLSYASSAIDGKVFSHCTYKDHWKANEETSPIGVHSLSHFRMDFHIKQLDSFKPIFGNRYALETSDSTMAVTEVNPAYRGIPLSSLFTVYRPLGEQRGQWRESPISAAWQLPNRRQLRDKAFVDEAFIDCYLGLQFEMSSVYAFFNHPR